MIEPQMLVLRLIFEAVGGAAIVLAVLRYFAKETVKNWFQKDLENFKTKIQLEADKEIELLKNRNQTILTEYKERISHLSKKRTDAIEGVSQKIIRVWAAFEQIAAAFKWSNGDPRHERSRKEFTELVEASNDLLTHFLLVEIFFPSGLSDKIFEFRRQVSITFDVYAGQLGTPHQDQEYVRKCNEEIRAEKEKLQPRFDEIRKDLRALLGVE
jgi:FtsZ-binding cell division protein ZapB